MTYREIYRIAREETAQPEYLYPTLAGHADWALPFIGGMVRHLSEPKFSNEHSQEFFRNAIRDAADDYTFVTEYARATAFYERYRDQWTDMEADVIGRQYLRAYRDMVPATAEDVPF